MSSRLKEFSPAEHATWKALFARQQLRRDEKIHPMFSAGLAALGIGGERVPDLDEVNRRLRQLSGFQGVVVTGLEDADSFYGLLAERKFPIGNFIRDAKDLSYTPAPDVFHDLYGHIPFFADREYADYCQRFGAAAMRIAGGRPERMRQFERFFWFTVEFGLIRTESGLRVFGAGLASSSGETDHALSEKPLRVPFSAEEVRLQEFRIDEFQKKLFVLEDLRQLYSSLEDFTRKVAA